jgi:hypothetical protein
MRKLLFCLLLGFPLLTFAKAPVPVGPIGFEPELILYQANVPVAFKLAPKIVKTIDDCFDLLKPIVASLTIKGVQVNGMCVPVPPAPAPEIKPQSKNPDGLNPETFQESTVG